MKWIEIIEIRVANSKLELLENELRQLIAKTEGETKLQTLKAYNRVMINTDYSIHLMHNSLKEEEKGSSLGLRIASAIKSFGLVNHSIWLEM